MRLDQFDYVAFYFTIPIGCNRIKKHSIIDFAIILHIQFTIYIRTIYIKIYIKNIILIYV